MANREFYDVIIIGGGPAGMSAGIYSLRASMRTVMIEKASPGGQVTRCTGMTTSSWAICRERRAP